MTASMSLTYQTCFPISTIFHCWIDYFGPLFIKIHKEFKKVWVCLYICLVTRAVHLELMSDMSTEQFK